MTCCSSFQQHTIHAQKRTAPCRFVQVLLALKHVHGKNVLHRDLKSQNIFIAEGERIAGSSSSILDAC